MATLNLIYGKDPDNQKWYTDDKDRRWYQKGQILDVQVVKRVGSWGDPGNCRIGLFFADRSNSKGQRETLGTDVELLSPWELTHHRTVLSCKIKISGSSVNSRHNCKYGTYLLFQSGLVSAKSFLFYITSNRTSYSRQHGSFMQSEVDAMLKARGPVPKMNTEENAFHVLHMETCMRCMGLDAKNQVAMAEHRAKRNRHAKRLFRAVARKLAPGQPRPQGIPDKIIREVFGSD